jgi:hypothetical protein
MSDTTVARQGGTTGQAPLTVPQDYLGEVDLEHEIGVSSRLACYRAPIDRADASVRASIRLPGRPGNSPSRRGRAKMSSQAVQILEPLGRHPWAWCGPDFGRARPLAAS